MASTFLLDTCYYERELYKTLVVDLSQDSKESMRLIALWIWLQRVGYRNVIYKIWSSPYTIINDLVEEGLTCLNCINTTMTHSSFEDDDIPTMRSLMDKKISLQILYENKDFAVRGLDKVFRECEMTLGDIMQQVTTRNSSEDVIDMLTLFRKCYLYYCLMNAKLES